MVRISDGDLSSYDEEDREHCRALVARHGASRAAVLVGCSRDIIVGFTSGARVHRGSRVQIRLGIQRLLDTRGLAS